MSRRRKRRHGTHPSQSYQRTNRQKSPTTRRSPFERLQQWSVALLVGVARLVLHLIVYALRKRG